MADAAYILLVPVFVDGTERDLPSGLLSGKQFREALSVPDDHNLWLGRNAGDDVRLDDVEIVNLRGGDGLYTTPKVI